ncbi:ABC transporter permease [Kroppenstedtia pulmonis]|uniref:ABC transporter permease n=1 Tax=Kroppenstedtia pulmonis TaxID=1380685 RepID=A0A7D4BGV8_9BACL|nr:FtsX-like permease family protein [Kroppenstedtia pulmonis]QKG85392.1 ABC transporter permease [Kroppenstedtia pulmonis]
MTITHLRKDGTIWIVVLYLLLSVMVASYSFFQVKQQELSMLTRGLYDSNPLSFVVKDHDRPIDWSKLDTDKPFTIFSELGTVKDKGGEYELRGIYYQKDTYHPPMVSGRFFEETDFYQGKKQAVVGRGVGESEKEWIEKIGYEIIGIMGASYLSPIDQRVFFNLDAWEQESPAQSDMYVMNIERDPIDQDGSLRFKGDTLSVKVVDRGDQGALRFLGTEAYQVVIYLLILLILISLSLLFTQYWMKKKNTEIRILWQMGIPIRQAFKRYATTYFFIALGCSILVGLISYLFLALYLPNPEAWRMHTVNLVKGYGLLLLSSGFSMWIAFKRSTRQTWKGSVAG